MDEHKSFIWPSVLTAPIKSKRCAMNKKEDDTAIAILIGITVIIAAIFFLKNFGLIFINSIQ